MHPHPAYKTQHFGCGFFGPLTPLPALLTYSDRIYTSSPAPSGKRMGVHGSRCKSQLFTFNFWDPQQPFLNTLWDVFNFNPVWSTHFSLCRLRRSTLSGALITSKNHQYVGISKIKHSKLLTDGLQHLAVVLGRTNQKLHRKGYTLPADHIRKFFPIHAVASSLLPQTLSGPLSLQKIIDWSLKERKT